MVPSTLKPPNEEFYLEDGFEPMVELCHGQDGGRRFFGGVRTGRLAMDGSGEFLRPTAQRGQAHGMFETSNTKVERPDWLHEMVFWCLRAPLLNDLCFAPDGQTTGWSCARMKRQNPYRSVKDPYRSVVCTQ